MVVGVNRFTDTEKPTVDAWRIDPKVETKQIEKVKAVRHSRAEGPWRRSLEEVRLAACGTANLVPPVITAVEAHATVGEISGILRKVFGEYRESE